MHMSFAALQISLVLIPALFSVVTATCPNGTHPLENGPSGICLPGPDGCPAGTFPRETYILPWATEIDCEPCPSGFTTFTNGARLCRRIGFPCPDGHRETESGDCWRCDADEHFDLSLQRCVPCPTGTGAAPGLSLWCAPCSKIVERNVKDSDCIQYNVFVPQLPICPAGSYVVYRDSSDVPVCRNCDPGSFSNRTNAAGCTPCPSGTVAAEEGADSCIPCPPDSAPNDEFNPTTCIRNDTGCPSDLEPAVVGGENICRSHRCGNGDDSIQAAIGRVCGPCGTEPYTSGFLTEDSEFAGPCDFCPLDSLSDGLVCTTCPRGQVRLDDGRCGCHGPLALTRGVDENGNCVRCPEGSYGVPGADGENVCTMCPPGTHYFSQTDRELLGCYQAIRCTSFSDLCIACGPGTFSNVEGSLICEACPEGTLSYGDGARRCLREGEPSAIVPFNDPFGNSL